MNSKPFKKILYLAKSALVFLLALSWIFSPFANLPYLPKKLVEELKVEEAYAATTDVFTLASGTNSAGYGSWVPVAGVTSANVACWGGGGGAGNGFGGGTGGGGGGAFASSTVSVTAGTQYTIFIGAGGIGKTGSAGNGTGGATSTFATTTVVAASGGLSKNPGAADGPGGAGGRAAISTGTVRNSGGDGGGSTNSGDTSGGGGGAAGPHGAGANGIAGDGTVGGAGGQGDNAHGGAGGAGGSAGNGAAGTANALGGGGGGGGDDGKDGAAGATAGAGGGGAEGDGGDGASGRCEITYTVPPAGSLTQDGYRWRANHQGETGATWLAAEDTVITGAGNTTASTTRLRILVDETASAATTTLYQLEYATSTSAGCSSLTYVRVADQASSTGYAWKMSPTAQFANAVASTNIADPNGLTDPTGSFRAGVTQDTASRVSSGIAHAAGEFTELEWSIEAAPRAHVTGQSYCFRVTNADDTTNITYSAYPKINLATSSPALSQLHYRWRANHQSETGTTWLAAEDIPITSVYTASTTRLRMVFDETGGKTGTTTLYQLEYATSTISGYSGCSALSTWVPIPMTASSTSYAWIATSTAQLVNRNSTTNVASGLNDPLSGLFIAGQTLDRNSTTTPLLLLDGDNFTEIEWTLQAKAEAEGDSYCFRATNADSTTNITYTVYGRASIATSTFTQSNFRIYKNTNNITPSIAWDNLGINGSMLSTTTSERMGGGDEFRLRMNVTVGTVDLPSAAHQFSLQYAELSSGVCSALAQASWKNTGAKDTSVEVFTFVDNLSVADTATISDVTPLSSSVGGLYQEVQNTTANPTGALEGRTVEYDWALKYPSARYSGTTFCFRMAKSDGSVIAAYGGYPRVLTNFVGAGDGVTVGAPVGGSGTKGNATTTGGTQGGGGDSGQSGNPPQSGGGSGGGGEARIPFFRYFAGVLWGVVEFVMKILHL